MNGRTIGLLAAAILALLLTVVGFTIVTGSNQVGPGQPRSTGVATVGGPFTLTATDGKTVTEKDLLGKPSAIFFGFTFCPEVCPTTLFELTALAEQLGSDADKLNFVFISVDPERDGPEEMKQYISAFDNRIIGLTGTVEQIDAAAKAFKIYYAKVPLENGDYTMDHTASVLLMDGQGKFFGTMAYEEAADVMLAKLKRLVNEG
ncbi:SCO family protein [Tianweitania sediminis]|uniref:SCO family protein n=1 Tax=Tianweitania sediminis TaxID=1502156 RepID=A0A8J7R1H3_9HYPH|nr:SCO family protein [Tianweitania sediminis]MBP0440420.1 SCO family protein [Tianweitania sediminis]